MSFFVLIEIINIFKIFAMIYCFVINESIEIFFFINACVQNFIFYDDCFEPNVMLKNFNIELFSAMTQKLNMKFELNVINNEIKLQLCFWHAAKAIKKRLINEKYSSKMKSKLINKIWNWVKTSTIFILNERRIDLMNHFRLKKITYVTEYYDSKKHQFVYAFIRFLSNLKIKSTQKTKNNHCIIKNVVNRHISIQNDVRKIMKKMQNMFIDRKRLSIINVTKFLD